MTIAIEPLDPGSDHARVMIEALDAYLLVRYRRSRIISTRLTNCPGNTSIF